LSDLDSSQRRLRPFSSACIAPIGRAKGLHLWHDDYISSSLEWARVFTARIAKKNKTTDLRKPSKANMAITASTAYEAIAPARRRFIPFSRSGITLYLYHSYAEKTDPKANSSQERTHALPLRRRKGRLGVAGNASILLPTIASRLDAAGFGHSRRYP
jgi:hypothetical protein